MLDSRNPPERFHYTVVRRNFFDAVGGIAHRPSRSWQAIAGQVGQGQAQQTVAALGIHRLAGGDRNDFARQVNCPLPLFGNACDGTRFGGAK
ncbi:MAG: hypothetical protein U1F56_16100 [Rubrivivax sp.]